MLRRPVEFNQYLSIRYTERLAEAAIEPSVGRVGDSYDNALAESIIGLYKTEVFVNAAPGATSKQSSLPPSNGSTGSTTADSWKGSAMCRRRNLKSGFISSAVSRPWWPDSNYSVSGKPGAVQFTSATSTKSWVAMSRLSFEAPPIAGRCSSGPSAADA